jgi:hypothetical protein
MASKKNVYKFLFEIVTIFIGITLSFAFEEYRQNRNAKNNRDEIIRSLIADVDFKKKEIQEDIEALKWQYQVIDSCILSSSKMQKVSKKLARDLHSVLAADYSNFDPTTPSYLSLTATGIWQQLPDTLRRRIYGSYNHDFKYLEIMYRKGAEYSSFIQEHYLVSNSLMGPMNEDPDFDLTDRMLANAEFRSALMLFRNQNYNTIDRLHKTSRRLDHLSKSLDASLKQ